LRFAVDIPADFEGTGAAGATLAGGRPASLWFLPPNGETLVARALDLRDSYGQGTVSLVVPDMFWPELGNILWKAVRVGRIPREPADKAVQAMSEFRLPTIPSLGLLREAFSIAITFQCTVYDAVYVALAVLSGRTLVTADERLANTLAAHFPVRWLGAI
jgi:predicted nucleic acid-binding protein